MPGDERSLETNLNDPRLPAALVSGELELLGLLPNSSNYTFLARATMADEELLAVYKPRRGETPLWDFPRGTLCQREVAAYVLSEALGWALVPPTVSAFSNSPTLAPASWATIAAVSPAAPVPSTITSNVVSSSVISTSLSLSSKSGDQ